MEVLQAMLAMLVLEQLSVCSNQCLQSDLSEVQFQTVLRLSVAHASGQDGAFAKAAAGWASRISNPTEKASFLLEKSLDALDSVDRNANLSVLIDAWSAVIEAPQLAKPVNP